MDVSPAGRIDTDNHSHLNGLEKSNKIFIHPQTSCRTLARVASLMHHETCDPGSMVNQAQWISTFAGMKAEITYQFFTGSIETLTSPVS